MSDARKVLIVDDQIGDIGWAMDLLRHYGYLIDVATNEEAACRRLEKVSRSELSYSLAIFDIMVATRDMEDLVEIDEQFLEESRDTGVRLCQYVRTELQIPASMLPIVCISARDDDSELRYTLRKLGIPLFSRTPQNTEESLRHYIDKHLAPAKPTSAPIEGER